MSDFDWLEPLDRLIEEVQRETKETAALKHLYAENNKGMRYPEPLDSAKLTLPTSTSHRAYNS